MKHIHIEIKPGAVATFSKKPSKITLKAVLALIEAAEKKFNKTPPKKKSMKTPTVDVIHEIAILLLKMDGFEPVDGNWNLNKSNNPRVRGSVKKARRIYNLVERLNKKHTN